MDRPFRDALAERISAMAGSRVYLNLYSPSMMDFENNPWPAIELALAILLDRPIILACLPGRQPPQRLLKIADHVVYGGPEEIAVAATAYIKALEEGRPIVDGPLEEPA